jgi:hypothetical protein
MAPEPDVTIGEIGRRLDRLESTVHNGFEALGKRIEGLPFLPVAVYMADKATVLEQRKGLEAEIKVERERLDHIEASIQWLARALAGAVVTGVVAAVFAAVRFGG